MDYLCSPLRIKSVCLIMNHTSLLKMASAGMKE